MSANSDYNLNDEDREQLVAYLDGELSVEESTAVEDRLSTDAEFRKEMQRLSQAWDVLDHLPREAASGEFAKTTIEMVALNTEKDLAEVTSKSQKIGSQRSLMSVAVLAASLLVGFFFFKQLSHDPNQVLVAQLPAIEQLDTLKEIPDVDFLRAIAKSFQREVEITDKQELVSFTKEVRLVYSSNNKERKARISKLSVEDQSQLASQSDRFSDLSEAEQKRLEQLHQQIVTASDSDKLLNTMLLYKAWLKDRSAGEKAEFHDIAFSDMKKEERFHKVGKFITQKQKRKRRALTATESAAVKKALALYLKEHRDDITKLMPEKYRNRLDGIKNDDHFATMIIVGSQFGRFRLPESVAKKIYGRIYKELFPVLSKESQAYLNSMNSDQQRRRVLNGWIARAMHERPKPTGQELEAYFENELTNEEREQLLALPFEEMQRALENRLMGPRHPGWGKNGKGRPSARDRFPGFRGPSQGGRGPNGRGPGGRGYRGNGERSKKNGKESESRQPKKHLGGPPHRPGRASAGKEHSENGPPEGEPPHPKRKPRERPPL